MSSILVKDYMQHNVQALRENTSVHDAVEHLLKWGITGAPVVDADMKVIGFVSEQDCMRDMLNSAFYADESARISRIMRTDVLVVTPETSVLEIAETMLGDKPKNFPVVVSGRLVGLINRRHILQALMEHDGCCFSPRTTTPYFVVAR